MGLVEGSGRSGPPVFPGRREAWTARSFMRGRVPCLGSDGAGEGVGRAGSAWGPLAGRRVAALEAAGDKALVDRPRPGRDLLERRRPVRRRSLQPRAEHVAGAWCPGRARSRESNRELARESDGTAPLPPAFPVRFPLGLLPPLLEPGTKSGTLPGPPVGRGPLLTSTSCCPRVVHHPCYCSRSGRPSTKWGSCRQPPHRTPVRSG